MFPFLHRHPYNKTDNKVAMTIKDEKNNTESRPKIQTALLLIVFVLFIFNFNFEVFRAGAASPPVVGGGTPGFLAKWLSAINPPSAPTITGPASGTTNINYSYDFNSTDPAGQQIRYGIDWNMDDTADEWLPAGVTYVNSGVTQTTSHSWPSTATFQSLAQNFSGVNSAWTTKTVTLFDPINGQCAAPPAGSSYSSTPPGPYCTPTGGTPTALDHSNPLTWTWNCIGSGVGHTDSGTCTARLTPFPVNVVSVSPGGSVKTLSPDNSINCTSAGGSCSALYDLGSVVVLKATPASSYWKFLNWSLDCSGTNPTCTLTVDAAKNVTATFGPRDFIYIEF
jgi:Divergent InlB B-repeat domain